MMMLTYGMRKVMTELEQLAEKERERIHKMKQSSDITPATFHYGSMQAYKHALNLLKEACFAPLEDNPWQDTGGEG